MRPELIAAFVAAGYRAVGPREWRGPLLSTPSLDAVVVLPIRFPYELPEVRIDPASLPKRVAHVEVDGRICYASTNGLLLDVDRPVEVLRRALDMAAAVLTDGLAGTTDGELLAEYLAYWKATVPRVLHSICVANEATRLVIVTHVTPPLSMGVNKLTLVSDSHRQAREWVGNVGGKRRGSARALMLKLEDSLAPPDVAAPAPVGELLRQLRQHMSEGERQKLQALVRDEQLQFPLSVLLSMPSGSAGENIVAGAEVPQAPNHANGFRPGRTPAWVGLLRARRLPIHRVDVVRLDAPYLLARAGGRSRYTAGRVVLIGCGAVGSELAVLLAASGVSALHLVDDDLLTNENVHRHALGAESLWQPKVEALRRQLLHRFPNLIVTFDKLRAEQALADPRTSWASDAALVVVAIGEPTAEKWLSRRLHADVPRVHVWVEAYGLGGHAVLTSSGAGAGCFECLVTQEAGNRLALAADGQNFGRSLAGCAGTFTPFGALDARAAANEGARLVLDFLDGEHEPRLVSWMGDSAGFQRQGFRLSARGSSFRRDETRREALVPRVLCKGCSAR